MATILQSLPVGQKVGMTQVWDDQNRVVPVTVVKVAPCRVVQVKTPETDGYSALQVTFGTKDVRTLNKPEAGHFEKAGVAEADVRRAGLAADPGYLPWLGRKLVLEFEEGMAPVDRAG